MFDTGQRAKVCMVETRRDTRQDELQYTSVCFAETCGALGLAYGDNILDACCQILLIDCVKSLPIATVIGAIDVFHGCHLEQGPSP